MATPDVGFLNSHVELLWWLVILLGGGVISLIVYIYLDKTTAQKGALITLETNLTGAVNALKDSVNRLTDTVETLRDDVFGEIDAVKEVAHRIDIRLKTVETVCKERSRHCPLYTRIGSHLHGRSGEPIHGHDRHDDYVDGSEV